MHAVDGRAADGDDGCGGSVARVRAALRAAGHDDAVREFAAGTRSAADAAAAVGCDVAAIAKSVVFRAGPAGDGHDGERPVLVIASGGNRVDRGKLAALLGRTVRAADADWVRARTGFAIGGVSPVGHLEPPLVLIDEDLFRFERVWAAAGSPRHVFGTTPAELARISGAGRAAVREDRAA